MIIISHRGLWSNASEKNSPLAFQRSFELGFGTETDIRDYLGDLVISHDIANSSSMPFDEFLNLYVSYSRNLPLALNIKADGLQKKLLNSLDRFKIHNYFVFDMSVPDACGYINLGMKTFTRQSEFEAEPVLYESTQGIWLDEFRNHWINRNIIEHHMQQYKDICIVSPELHMRPKDLEWAHYCEISRTLGGMKNVMLCTDFPEEANRVFNGH